ncbi:PB1 domain-containing protein, partial [Mycena albidolilacea]
VKLRVEYGDDLFAIQVRRTSDYNEVAEILARKMRLCGPRRDDNAPPQIKYRDEDGDMVTINCTEDVQMAFEEYRERGYIPLYAS